jgi:hypothetical protein
MRKQVEEQIKQLEEMDVIEKVEGPTPWVDKQMLRCSENSLQVRSDGTIGSNLILKNTVAPFIRYNVSSTFGIGKRESTCK